MRDFWGLNVVFAALLFPMVWIAIHSPKLLIVVLAVVIGGAVIFLLENWQRFWVALIVLLFFSTSNQVALLHFAYYPRYVVAVILATLTWSTNGKDARPLDEAGRPASRLVKGLWLCAGVALVSVGWSVDAKTTLLQALALTALAWLVHGLVTRRWQDHDKMVSDLGLAGIVLSLLFAAGIAADAAGALPAYTSGLADNGRLRGYYDNPQALGITAALVFLVIFGVWRETKKFIYLLALIPCGWSVLLSESRTGQVAIAGGLVWVAIRDRARIKHLLQAAFIAFLVAMATWAGVIPTTVLTSPFARFTGDHGDDLLNTRNLAWSEALHLWSQRPIPGYGYSAGPAQFRYVRGLGQSQFDADVVHNSYLQWFLETGLIGLFPMAMVLFAALAVVFKGRIVGVNIGLVAVVFAGLLIQVTESAMFGTGSNYPFLFWPVVAAATLGIGSDRKHSGSDREVAVVQGAHRV